jgi:predicted DNA-binding protein
MSELTSPAAAGAGGQMRTLAVRITEELRAQLDIISQLTGRSATEEIRLALEHWIDKTKSDPNVLERAEAVRAEIERDAQTRRNAIAAIFSGDGTTGDDSAPHLVGAKAPTSNTTRPFEPTLGSSTRREPTPVRPSWSPPGWVPACFHVRRTTPSVPDPDDRSPEAVGGPLVDGNRKSDLLQLSVATTRLASAPVSTYTRTFLRLQWRSRSVRWAVRP